MEGERNDCNGIKPEHENMAAQIHGESVSQGPPTPASPRQSTGSNGGVAANSSASYGQPGDLIQSSSEQEPAVYYQQATSCEGTTMPVPGGFAALPNTPPVEIKLFVGRVPRTADENVLRPVFGEFGVVSEIAIIKDRATGMHKGSAFVRMASITQADAAIRSLNNIKVLDPQLGALQVRYATGEAEKLGMTAESAYPGQDQAKLFVGSLPRNITEDEVRTIFSHSGQIDEVFIMKDSTTGQGKGCAFVKFAYKEQAIHAIKTLSGIQQLAGAPRPLEVRFAESKKALQSQQPGAAVTMAPGGTDLSMLSTEHPHFAGAIAAIPGQAIIQPGAIPGATIYGQQQPQQQPATSPSFANCNPRTAGPWKEYFTEDGRPYYHNEQTSQTQWERPAEFDRQDVAGPPGANIFVFHVPNDWTQADLQNNFAPFGQVVSARIATDKSTGRNKGYAFVSYANIQSAAQAVQHMNGFMAGSKRLKVSIKQNEEMYVQHLLNMSQGSMMPTMGGPMMGASTAAMGGYRGMPGGYGAIPSVDTSSMAASMGHPGSLTSAQPTAYTSAVGNPPPSGASAARYGAAPTGVTAIPTSHRR